MRADEYGLLESHTRRFPPSYLVVPRLLAVIATILSRAHWSDSKAVPEDFMPWTWSREEIERRAGEPEGKEDKSRQRGSSEAYEAMKAGRGTG